MKSTTTAYALAASFLPFVLASPFHQQRHAAVEVVTAVDVVTAYDQVYVTQYADAGAASSTPEAAPPAPATTMVTVAAPAPASSAPAEQQDNNGGRGNHQHNWNRPSSWEGQNNSGWNKPSSTPEAAPTPSSTPVAAPPPAPTTTSTPPPSPAPTTTSTPPPPPAPTTSSTPPPPPTTTPAVVVPVPTPAKTSSAAAKATLAPAQTGDDSYKADAMKASTLNSTNVWRYEFNASPLAWNDSLASMAQNTANACNWDHTNAGQNYAAGYSGPGPAVDVWGNEYTTFDFSKPDFSETCGHFTQLVWKDSTTMGCAAHKCPTDGSTSAAGWFLVCNYFPVGNMLGEFSENVASKSGLSPY